MVLNGKSLVHFFLAVVLQAAMFFVVLDIPIDRYCSATDCCLLEGLFVSQLACPGQVSAFTLPLVLS